MITRWNCMTRCERHDLVASLREERIAGNHKRADMQLGEGGEGSIDLALIAGFRDLELYPLSTSRFLHLSDRAAGNGTDEQAEYPRIRNQLGEKLEPFGLQRVRVTGETCEVAPWSSTSHFSPPAPHGCRRP